VDRGETYARGLRKKGGAEDVIRETAGGIRKGGREGVGSPDPAKSSSRRSGTSGGMGMTGPQGREGGGSKVNAQGNEEEWRNRSQFK